MLITKLLAVAVFVLPATSLATPSRIESMSVPGMPPAPLVLVTSKTLEEKGAVVNAFCVMTQPVDSMFLVISEMSKPLMVSLKVTVIENMLLGAV